MEKNISNDTQKASFYKNLSGKYIFSEYRNSDKETINFLNKKEKRILGMLCIERQYRSYESFAVGKPWGRIKEYRTLLDLCWESVLNEEELSEEVWNFHEEIKPEYVNCDYEENQNPDFSFCNIFSTHIEELLDMILDDLEGGEDFRYENLEYIEIYMDELNEKYEKEKLFLQEIQNQKMDFDFISSKGYLKNLKEYTEKFKSLLTIQ